MPEYYNVTTNLGDAEIANAIATNTKLNITHIAFGDGNGAVPIPTKSRTSLVREVHRQAVTKYERHKTNPNWIVIETIIPSSVGGFTIREMGIIANGKLISNGSHAPFEKVADPTGVSEYRLKFTQNVQDGSVVEITLDESLIYASQAWVEENFIKRNEIIDDLITNDATKPVSAKQAKLLQDSKLNKTENAVSATKLATARTINGVAFDGSANIDLPTASTSTSGTVQLNNSLTSTSTSQALTAAQGKALQDGKLGKTENAESATKLSTASGNAPSYSARAWVNFNGTGTVKINGSGNVSSITDNGTGDYTVNFSTAMPNTNYATVFGVGDDLGGASLPKIITVGNSTTAPKTKTVGACRIGFGGDVYDFSAVFFA